MTVDYYSTPGQLSQVHDLLGRLPHPYHHPSGACLACPCPYPGSPRPETSGEHQKTVKSPQRGLRNPLPSLTETCGHWPHCPRALQQATFDADSLAYRNVPGSYPSYLKEEVRFCLLHSQSWSIPAVHRGCFWFLSGSSRRLPARFSVLGHIDCCSPTGRDLPHGYRDPCPYTREGVIPKSTPE